VAVAAGACVAGAYAATAASLGALTVQSLGTTAKVVAACNGGAGGTITGWGSTGLTYFGAATATATTGSTYRSTRLTYSVGAGCAGKLFKLTLATASGVSVGAQVTGTIGAGGNGTIVYAAKDSKSIAQITLTVYR